MKPTAALTILVAAIFGPRLTTALFDCNADQHAFPATAGKFVVHYTSIRDENLDGQPWIRICLPATNGGFTNVNPLDCPCNVSPNVFSASVAHLNHEISVTNGDGCSKSASGLDGAALDYNGQHRDLSGGEGNCGPRDHGISCEFDL